MKINFNSISNKGKIIFTVGLISYFSVLANFTKIFEYCDSRKPEKYNYYLTQYKNNVGYIERNLIVCDEVKDTMSRHNCNYNSSKEYRKAYDKYYWYNRYIEEMKQSNNKKYNK